MSAVGVRHILQLKGENGFKKTHKPTTLNIIPGTSSYDDTFNS